ncbi:MAG: hypothetical protein JW797_06695 [Bradymonadales bacterium]|nr:hypothetical protein [Bradymonadales bacterium]
MALIAALALILCGVLASASAIVKRKPDAQQLFDKLLPYQGWIGVVVGIWGIVTIIHAFTITIVLRIFPLWWITYFVTGLLELALGFILGFALISKYVLSKNAEAEKKGEEVRAKLAVYQVPLGYAAIILGLWGIIAYIIYF